MLLKNTALRHLDTTFPYTKNFPLHKQCGGKVRSPLQEDVIKMKKCTVALSLYAKSTVYARLKPNTYDETYRDKRLIVSEL